MKLIGDDRPICQKCKDKFAITKMDNGLWMCGDCLMKWKNHVEKLNKQMILDAKW